MARRPELGAAEDDVRETPRHFLTHCVSNLCAEHCGAGEAAAQYRVLRGDRDHASGFGAVIARERIERRFGEPPREAPREPAREAIEVVDVAAGKRPSRRGIAVPARPPCRGRRISVASRIASARRDERAGRAAVLELAAGEVERCDGIPPRHGVPYADRGHEPRKPLPAVIDEARFLAERERAWELPRGVAEGNEAIADLANLGHLQTQRGMRGIDFLDEARELCA